MSNTFTSLEWKMSPFPWQITSTAMDSELIPELVVVMEAMKWENSKHSLTLRTSKWISSFDKYCYIKLASLPTPSDTICWWYSALRHLLWLVDVRQPNTNLLLPKAVITDEDVLGRSSHCKTYTNANLISFYILGFTLR